MWIRGLSVKHFAGIRSVDLELVAGLNVLHGPNELGKSTLVTAIRAALLLQDGATASQAFVDWHTDQPPQVTLTFETEPQRIWRVRKSFGKGSDGWSYLDFSRDGTTFTQDAKGRDVDGKIRETLRWGLDAPGGKGKKKGFGESFLSTTLLAEQGAVTTVLTRGLDQDPGESGKRRLAEALQALAEDPVFRQILAATQQRVDAAYTSSGQKSRQRGSPWMELRTQLQAAQKRRLEIRSQVSDSEGARGHVDERRDALNDAQSHLDQSKTLRTQLETAWHQQQTRDAVQAKVVEAMAERDRIQGLHDQLADVTTALDAAGKTAKTTKRKLQASEKERETAQTALQGARERMSAVERSNTEQTRTIRKQEIDKSLLENQGHQRATEQRRTHAANVKDLEAKTEELRAEVQEKSSTLGDAKALVDDALSQNQIDADAIASIEEGLLAARVLAARRDRDTAQQNVREAAELGAVAKTKHEEAQGIRAEIAKLGLPDADKIDALATLQTDLQVAEAKLQVGLSVDIRPARQIAASIRIDDGPLQDTVLTEAKSLNASAMLQLILDDVGEIDIRGGSLEARQEAKDLRRKWRTRTSRLFKRLGVTELADVRAKQRDCNVRLEQAEALEREAQSATTGAEAAADADSTSTVELHDTTVKRLEQRMVSSLSGKRDLEEVMHQHASADQSDEAALEQERDSLKQAVDDRAAQARVLEQQLAKDEGILETKKQELVAQEAQLSAASDALSQQWAVVLEQAGEALERLGSERQEKQQELKSLEHDLTSEIDQARAAVQQASALVENADQTIAKLTAQAEDAQRDLDRLTGEVTTRRELAAGEDLQTAQAVFAQLQSRLEGLPRPETDVTDAQRTEGDGHVKEATDQRDGVQAELQKAEGALQQVGGHAIQEKLDQADEAVQAIDRREHELDLDYGAWQLLRDTLQEAEAEDAVHLGKALVEPITKRMAQLTGGRYGNLLIGPKLETEGIELEGTQRDLEALSVGTREQLATVLRLTIADALGSTVVLDDQLVQSDASRMDWLRAFMVECADRFQILVFTCHPEEYKSGRARKKSAFKLIDLAGCLKRSL